MPRTPWLVLAALLVATCAQARTAWYCPTSWVELGGGAATPHASANVDTATTPGGVFSGTGFAVQAHFLTGDHHIYQNKAVGITSLQANDSFDVTGVPAGTPVAVMATFTAHSFIWSLGCGDPNCAGWTDVQLQHGSDVADAPHTLSGSASYGAWTDALQLPVTIVAGQPETITCYLAGRQLPGGNHYSEVLGQLLFTGLPPGALVVSCWGYNSTATPVKRSTWGALKAIYR